MQSSVPKVGEVLSPGVRIRVDAKSEIVLLFSNGSVATIGPNSELSVSEFEQSFFSGRSGTVSELKEEPSVSSLLLDLSVGQLVADVKRLKKKSNFAVSTRYGVAGIRGTQFSVTSSKSSASVSVLEGEVVVTDPAGKTFSITTDKSLDLSDSGTSETRVCTEDERARIRRSNGTAQELIGDRSLSYLSDSIELINPLVKPKESTVSFPDSFGQGLVAWYPLDGNAEDFSGNELHGTLDGNHSWLEAGVLGGAITLPGGTIKVVGSEKLILGRGSDKRWSVSAWYKGNLEAFAILKKSKPPGWSRDTDYSLTFNDKGRLYWGTGHSRDKGAWMSIDMPVSKGWLHLVGTLVAEEETKGIKRIFVNGKMIAEKSYGIKNSSRGDTMTIGPFRGMLDDLRIYDRALSTQEVIEMYDHGVGATAKPSP